MCTTVYETLVLSGGGIKGFGMLGMLHKLNEIETVNFKNFIGSSVGGVIVSLLAVGLSAIEVFLFFVDLLPISYGKDRERVISKMKSLLKDVTFQELYNTNGNMLVLTAFDKKKQEDIFYSKNTYPTKKIIEAVAETSNIPFISNVEDVYIDGCLVSPFPIKYAKEAFQTPVLGIYTITKNTNLLPIPNPYDDFKMIFQQFMNKLTQYEICFSSNTDKIYEFETDIPFELFQVDCRLAKDLFVSGYTQLQQL